MKYLKFDLHDRCTSLYFMPLTVFLGAILGLGCTAIQVSTPSGYGKDFPFSLLFSFLGMFFSIFYYIYNYRAQLMLVLSMGQTRKSYFVYFVIRQSLLTAISAGMLYLFDFLQYELLLYLLGEELGRFHAIADIRFFLISGVSCLILTLFLSVMFARFGNRMFYALYGILFLLALMTEQFVNQVVLTFSAHIGLVKLFSVLLVGGLVLVSIFTARRQACQ